MRPEAVDVPVAASARPSAAPESGPGSTPNTVHPVTGGGQTYLIDTANGLLAHLNGTRPQPRRSRPMLQRRRIVNDSGTASAYSAEQGVLYEMSGTQVRRSSTVAMPDERAHLTLVDNKPVVHIPDRPGHGVALVPGRGLPGVLAFQYSAGAVRLAKIQGQISGCWPRWCKPRTRW